MRLILTLLFLFISTLAFCQGDIDDQQKALTRNEQSGHVLLNTNGWGLGYCYGKMVNARKKTLWNAEFNFIKSSKEMKINNPYFPDGRRFVYGKENDLLNLRLGYGKLKRIYSKMDQGGLEVRFFYHFGPTIAFLKPVYYEVLYYNSTLGYDIKTEQFSSSIHSYVDIYGGSSIFEGFSELSVVPGLYARVGTSFEFSKKDLVINALEGGVSIDLFPKKVPIMANDKNSVYYLSLFISYRFGQIMDPKLKIVNEAAE